MAAGRSSFTKRQKEHARLQKRQDKAEKKKMRAEEKQNSPAESDLGPDHRFQDQMDGYDPGAPHSPERSR